MPSALSSTQFLIFSALCLAGVAWIVVGSLFGGDGDGDADGDGGGGDHVGGHISLRVVAIFFGTFGAMGAILSAYGAGPVAATGAGLATGVPICVGWVLAVRALHRQEANSLVSDTIVGRSAVTLTELRPGQLGEISLTQAGSQIVRPARTAHDPIPANAPVRIVAYDGAAATVEAAAAGGGPAVG